VLNQQKREKCVSFKSALTHGFCGDCGTPLYSVAPVSPTLIFLRLGAINERHLLRPALQIWRRSTVRWLNELNSITGSPEQQDLAAK
ncbi:MAG: GFA family protein, partial [Rugosibacter sp.]|nr:GFA family protein [Rugosibacter sp.]